MNLKKYIVALDQGTTSSRAIIFDKEQNIIDIVQKEFTQFYPNEGYVEHDPMEIFATQRGVLTELLTKNSINASEIAAIGITNQRETTIMWDKNTGRPVYNAIVWQCRRTAAICEELKAQGLEEHIKYNTGLIIDAYFSATKIKWILDNVDGVREKAERGDILFGTVDSWLVWKMTNGRTHITDVTNASRTMLFNIRTLKWDEKILEALGIPRSILPEVKSSSEIYGTMNISGVEVPIAGIAGDQQAALFGQTCFEKGETKNTYGTGCFLLMNTGNSIYESKNGLLTTIAIGFRGKIDYAIEGSVFVGGAVVQWLRDELKLIDNSKETESIASSIEDNCGVYIVPAFAGLGAPHWDMYARGAIFGLTRGSGHKQLVRAALEAIAYQTKDVLDAMSADTGVSLSELKVDGGASANNFLMQFQSDIINKNIRRPMICETTALGAAYLAGLAVGFWKDLDEIKTPRTSDTVFTPKMTAEVREKNIKGWNGALERTKSWEA